MFSVEKGELLACLCGGDSTTAYSFTVLGLDVGDAAIAGSSR